MADPIYLNTVDLRQARLKSPVVVAFIVVAAVGAVSAEPAKPCRQRTGLENRRSLV